MKRLWLGLLAVGAVVAVVSVMAVVMAPRSTLEVASQPSVAESERAEGVVFWVPTSAPIEEMELGDSTDESCSEELTSWLLRYGSTVVGPQPVLIETTASAASISLRAEGRTSPAKPGFIVQCGFPEISSDPGLDGELTWSPALLRLGEDGVELLEPTEDGPEPLVLTTDSATPAGVVALIQGDLAFDGRITATVEGENGSVDLPFAGAGGTPSTSLAWPGIPIDGTLRVVVGTDHLTDEMAFLCDVAYGTLGYAAGYECFASEGPDEDLIRTQANRYRDNYIAAAQRDQELTENPLEGPVGSSKTVLIREDPWADVDLDLTPAPYEASGCYRDRLRSDRVDCSASLHCYLNADESLGACLTLTGWRVFEMEEVPRALPDPDATVNAVELKLTNGETCLFHSGAGPEPAVGFDGWVGSCANGTLVLWAKWRDEMPLDSSYLFESASGSYLQVAAGPEFEEPTFYDVAEIHY